MACEAIVNSIAASSQTLNRLGAQVTDSPPIPSPLPASVSTGHREADFIQAPFGVLAEDRHRCATVEDMNRCRRSTTSPLAPTHDPTWLVVRNSSSDVIEITPLEPKADLRRALDAAREARIAAGWTVDPIGRSSSCFFCAKDGKRLMIGIERRDPAKPPQNHGSRRS